MFRIAARDGWRKPPSVKPPESLLIIKPSSLGDIVHGLQVVRNAALAWPDCHITWVVRDRFAGLVEAAPFIHEVIHYRRKEGWRGLRDVMRSLRARKFDLVWDMQGLLRSGLMTAAARSSTKWGRADARECAGLFYQAKVPLPAGPGLWHAVPILQGFLRKADVEETIRFPLPLDDGPDFSWFPFFNGDPRKQFVIFTDSRGVGKEWPKFSELTRLIWDNIPDSRVAWCAGQNTAPEGEIPKGRFLNLTGCPMDEMIELVRRPSTFIGNDSGPMHLSAALGNRVLAIFGPTAPERFGPWPPGADNTAAVRAPGGVLMDLKPQAVLDRLLELTGRD